MEEVQLLMAGAAGRSLAAASGLEMIAPRLLARLRRECVGRRFTDEAAHTTVNQGALCLTASQLRRRGAKDL